MEKVSPDEARKVQQNGNPYIMIPLAAFTLETGVSQRCYDGRFPPLVITDGDELC